MNNAGNAFVDALVTAKGQLTASGAITHLIAISLGEELYGGLNGGPSHPYNNPAQFPTLAPFAGDRIGQANALRDLLEARYDEINTVFPAATYPNVYTTLFDLAWNDDPESPYGDENYFPPPTNLDVLGIDPYFTGNVLGCDAATQMHWNNHVAARVNYVLLHFPQPLMLIGQAFREPPGFPYAPATCQLEWWYQLAVSNSKIVALQWFAYGYAPTQTPVGVRHPDHQPQLFKLAEIFDRNLQAQQ